MSQMKNVVSNNLIEVVAGLCFVGILILLQLPSYLTILFICYMLHLIFTPAKWHTFRLTSSLVMTIVAMYMHLFQFPSDIEFEDEITTALSLQGTYTPGNHFATAENVCFLPPYHYVDSRFPETLSEYSRFKLKISVNIHKFGQDDGVWWIVGVKDKDVVFQYKMDTYNVSVKMDKQTCFITNTFVLESIPSVRGIHSFVITNKE